MNAFNPSGPPEIAWPAIAAVVLLTALATLAHWWLKRRGLVPASTNPIKVVATRSLGPNRAVAVVEVDSQRFLLGLTDESGSCMSALAPEPGKAVGSSTSAALGTVVALPTGTGR
jgi:flagellar biogenesis protein FliO